MMESRKSEVGSGNGWRKLALRFSSYFRLPNSHFRVLPWFLLIAVLLVGAAGVNKFDNVARMRFVSTFRASIGLAKEVHLAIRTDNPLCVANICGSGTKDDPYDCGPVGASVAVKKAKFDAINAANNSNTNFYPQEGIYYTDGWKFGVRQTANSGCKWFGAGIGKTIIKLANSTETGPGVGIIFGADQAVRSPGFELHNMTLDCDATNQLKWNNDAHRTVSGISARPDHVWINYVEVINPGTNSVGAENFPIYVVAFQQSGTFEDAVVSNCYVHSVAGNEEGISAIVVGVIEGGTGSGMVARNNRVDMSGPGDGYTHGVGANLSEGNTFISCDSGFYCEPNGAHPGFISRNDTFVNCSLSVYSSARAGSTTAGVIVEGAQIYDDAATLQGGAIVITSDDNNISRYGRISVNNCTFHRTTNLSMVAITSTASASITNNHLNSTHPTKAIFASVGGFPNLTGNINDNGTTVTCEVNTAKYKQPDERKSVVFTPTTIGWYRIVDTTGGIGGRVQVTSNYDGHLDDIEFQYNIAQAGNQGSIQQTRYSSYSGANVGRARLSSTGASSVFLDLYVASAATPGPIVVTAWGPRTPVFVSSPTVGATVGTTDVNELAFGHGLRTTRDIVAAGNASVAGTATAALVQGNHSGNGSLLTQIQASKIDTSPRVASSNAGDVILNTTDYFVELTDEKIATQTVTLPSAALKVNKALYILDSTTNSATFPTTLIPDLVTGTYVFDQNAQVFACFQSNGTNWRLLYQYPAPLP